MSGGRRRAVIASGKHVFLRRPTARDAAAFVALMRASRRLHHPWITAPTTPAAFGAYLARTRRATHLGLLACRRDDGAIVGVFNLMEIVRASFQGAYLGYYATAPYAGQGYMSEALALVLRHAFTRLGLHRVEANIQPRNARSIAFARRAGFRREGYSRRYLQVRGRWRDHVRYALLVEDWRRATEGRGAR
jgi:[ribosomal protein S5]-alanine N-acetyltransferase